MCSRFNEVSESVDFDAYNMSPSLNLTKDIEMFILDKLYKLVTVMVKVKVLVCHG